MSTQKFSNPLITETDRVTELKLQQKQQQRQHQEQGHHQVADDQISSINGSVLSESPVSHITGFSPGIDPDIARMETLMEQWLGDLKRNVLVSLQFKISIQEVTFRFLNDRKGRLYFQKRQSVHGGGGGSAYWGVAYQEGVSFHGRYLDGAPPPPGGHRSGRCASYWNAFLLNVFNHYLDTELDFFELTVYVCFCA